MDLLASYWWIIVVLLFLFAGLKTINQGFVGVVTMFGKYRRVLSPGLNFLIPFFEQISRKVSIQKRYVEMEYQAVTADQANV
jgi:regulator of protease activity HflC (stomatin/prohibitin superfamily)